MDDATKKADAFVKDLKALVEEHYGKLAPEEVEPFGMRLREAMPIIDPTKSSYITTTVTISIYPPLDTDPPDTD